MGYEDVDYCLRAWQAGFQVVYAPSAQLHHHESVTRGTEVGERERRSQRVFWKRWGSVLRRAPSADRRWQAPGRVRHRGHDRGRRPPRRVRASQRPDRARPRRRTVDAGRRAGLVRAAVPGAELSLTTRSSGTALAPLEAIKVATWWKTAPTVWRASVLKGLPVYFVQDIETSYYPDDPQRRYEVLNTYRPEFRYLTISTVEPRAAARAGSRCRR